MMRTLCIAVAIASAVGGAAQLPTRPKPGDASVVHTNEDTGPQLDLLASDIFSSPAARPPSKFMMQGKIIEDHEGDTILTSTNVPNLDASIMLSQAGIGNFTNVTLVAWRKALDGAIVTGQRGTNYIAALLYRDSRTEGRNWRQSGRYYYMRDHRCLFIRSNREYDHPPTREDAIGLLSGFGGYSHKLILCGYIIRELPNDMAPNR